MTAEQRTRAIAWFESRAKRVTMPGASEMCGLAVEALNAQRWIPVSERLPEVETEVIILAITKTGRKVITTAMYENGKMPNGNSIWKWYDIDFNYDEENDEYLIPEGWWEYRHYNPDDIYNNAVDDVVTHWMPLPDPPRMDGEV